MAFMGSAASFFETLKLSLTVTDTIRWSDPTEEKDDHARQQARHQWGARGAPAPPQNFHLLYKIYTQLHCSFLTRTKCPLTLVDLVSGLVIGSKYEQYDPK